MEVRYVGRGRWRRPESGHTSGTTRWARAVSTARTTKASDRRWHGFPMLHKDGEEGRNTSYCGTVTVEGHKRAASPPRHDPICERCAEVCGFIRRPGRKTGRERGSRRLGTIMERLERAVDRLERWLDGNAKRADL